MDFVPTCEFQKRKGVVKLHTLLDLHGNIPSVVIVTAGKVQMVARRQYPLKGECATHQVATYNYWQG